MSKISTLRGQLLLGTALFGSVFTISGSRAYANGFCRLYGPVYAPGAYHCTGYGSVTEPLSGTPLKVTTNGLTLETTTGDAFTLTGTGGLTFTEAAGSSSTITGSLTGIDATNTGSGALTITNNGTVTGTTRTGIYANNSSAGTDLTINAADVTGGYRGITASHNGTGALNITTTGAVTGNDTGIDAASAEDITIHTADVTGGVAAMFVHENGAGALKVTTAGAVTGGTWGIAASSFGDGTISITTTGLVKGTTWQGIYAFAHSSTAGNLTTPAIEINAVDVTGGSAGIWTKNNGTGALNITTSGTVTGKEPLFGYPDTTYHGEGIYAGNFGSGALSITVNGTVMGGNRAPAGMPAANAGGPAASPAQPLLAGILVADGGTSASAARTITVNAGGVVQGATMGIAVESSGSSFTTIDNSGTIRNLSGLSSRLAIQGTDVANLGVVGDARLAIANKNLITGTLQLGQFADTFTNSGTWNTTGGSNDFGDGVDTLTNSGTVTAAGSGSINEGTFFKNLETFDNQGILNLRDRGTGDTATIGGNYVGSGGTLEIDTALGDDSSPTDMLVVEGDTSGQTTVKVTNDGGNGAPTVQGIKIIDVKGASNGEFSLAGDTVIDGQQAVVAGAYAYTLQKNGVATPTDGDWYLRSQLTNDDKGLRFQPGAPSYEALSQALLGLNGLPDSDGYNRYWSAAGNAVIEQGDGGDFAETGPLSDGSVVVDGSGMWGRVEGYHSRFNPAVSTSSTDFDVDAYKMEAGFDGQFYESDAGQLIGGLTVHYANASTAVSSVHGGGNIDTDGYGFGGTLGWYGDNGFYVDGEAWATWYDSDLSSHLTHRSLADGVNSFG